ncbi:MAG: DUF934 domain-containing protein [Roseinatronobacter sp.]
MSVIVTDSGFAPDDWRAGFTPLEAFDADPDERPLALDLPSDIAPEALEGRLQGIAFIRIDFPAFSDGRGFSVARQLRRMGFAGRLRARGHVISDQYAMARRSGFDEVEISDALAERQPAAEWLSRANWAEPHYQSRLREGGVPSRRAG